MQDKDTISWECEHCGHRHQWQWDRGEASEGPIRMDCECCGLHTLARLVQIGKRVWAAAWRMF